jgi:hypothetical protein
MIGATAVAVSSITQWTSPGVEETGTEPDVAIGARNSAELTIARTDMEVDASRAHACGLIASDGHLNCSVETRATRIIVRA